METKKQPGISSQHLEAILASEGRQEDVEEEEVGIEDNETVSENLQKKWYVKKYSFYVLTIAPVRQVLYLVEKFIQ